MTGVREMRAMSAEAMRAEALAAAGNESVRRAYCQGIQDALAWAMTGEPSPSMAAMRNFLTEQHANGRAWQDMTE